MRKIKTLSILGLLLLTAIFSACSSKYTVAKENMPEEVRQKLEASLKEATAPGDIAYLKMELGDYGEAIDLYKEVLESNPTDFPALNNLAVMYEEVGEIQEALTYEKILYTANSLNREVISDTIRLLIANKQFQDAQGVLQAYAVTPSGGEDPSFISDQYQLIYDASAQ